MGWPFICKGGGDCKAKNIKMNSKGTVLSERGLIENHPQ